MGFYLLNEVVGTFGKMLPGTLVDNSQQTIVESAGGVLIVDTNATVAAAAATANAMRKSGASSQRLSQVMQSAMEKAQEGAEVQGFNAGLVAGSDTLNSKAILEAVSTTKGFLPPRLTTTQRDAIASPPAGLTVYNTTTNKLNFYNGSAWEAVTSA